MAEGTGGGFNFQQFIEDSKNVLIAPKDYFASMAKEGGFVEPIIKALIYGAIGGLLGFLWNALGLNMFGVASFSIKPIIVGLIAGIIGLFLGGLIMLVISAICSGSTDFEANVRVNAAFMVIYPIMSLFGFLNRISWMLSIIVTVAISLYFLYILYHAIVQALGGKEPSAKVVSIVLSVFPILLLLSSLLCGGAAKFGGDVLKQQNKSQVEAMKRLEMMQKKIQEAAEKNQ